MSRDLDITEALALWAASTTEQPMVVHPRSVDVFDQLVGGQPYPRPRRKPTWATVTTYSLLAAAGGYLAGLAAPVFL
jgi:hypothetical protein